MNRAELQTRLKLIRIGLNDQTNPAVVEDIDRLITEVVLEEKAPQPVPIVTDDDRSRVATARRMVLNLGFKLPSQIQFIDYESVPIATMSVLKVPYEIAKKGEDDMAIDFLMSACRKYGQQGESVLAKKIIEQYKYYAHRTRVIAQASSLMPSTASLKDTP